MIRVVTGALFSLCLVTGSAFAFHCPADMKLIDDALAAGVTLSDEQLAEVTALRAEGEELHNAGDHAASVEALGKAMAILGIGG